MTMYKVTVQTAGKTYPLYIPGADDLQLEDPVLTLELNSSGSLTFDIPSRHPYHDKIKPLSSEFYVYQNGTELFRGRNTGSEEDFYKTGTITCEGDLAYLLDSIQRPYDHTGSIDSFFTVRLAEHNKQVEARKQFLKGTVNVVDNTSNAQRVTDTCATTLDCIKNELIGPHGGYLRTRLSAGKRYLDYLIDFGGYNSQRIRFRENLLDLGRKRDATTIRTAIIPYGAQLETTNADGTASSKRLDITTVNGGVDYVYNQEAVNRYGWIWASVTWDEITDPAVLKNTALAYLEDTVSLPDVLELTAVDLSLTDTEIPALKLGYWTRVTSEPHGLTGEYLLTKKVLHLTEPERDTIVLGGTVEGITGSTSRDMAAITQRIEEISRQTTTELTNKINNATKLITGGLGGYIVIGMASDGHPDEIVIMDAPSIAKAKNVIRLNKNGMGFSSTGYNGVYRNAWTIDGNLVADFITTGTMLANRIRGGLLELGGSGLGKDGVLVIKNSEGKEMARFSKDGITIVEGNINITAGSINLGSFRVTSSGVLTLDGTNNSTSIGCNVMNANHVEVQDALEVNGGMSVSGPSNLNGPLYGNDMTAETGYFRDWCFSPNWTYGSSRDMKKYIHDMDREEARRLIMQLRPRIFHYRKKYGGQKSMGFIVDELEGMSKKFPLISRHGDLAGVDYGTYVPMIVAALQLLQDEVDDLKEAKKDG